MNAIHIRFAAWLAIGFGVFLGFAEVVRNWGDWGYWPFWVVDYIAVGLLLYGGVRALRPPIAATTVPLAGAWGFTCAMFYGSFFSHLANLDRPDHGPIEPVRLTVTIGVMFAITVVGFTLSLVPARRRSEA